MNKVEHNKKALIAAMEKSLGIVTVACKQAGVGRTSFYEYYNSDPDFKKEIDGIEGIACDFVESALHRRISEGSDAAMIFYLKCKGKARGYVERQQIELKNDGDSTFKVEFV